MFNYPTIIQANRGVLAEASTIMAASGVEYVVVGGWVPYLRSAGNKLRHPGTSDVDLLFNSDISRVKAAVPLFLDAGYTPSAKHPFQLLKNLTVGGREFVFNIDLMYPAESEITEDDMFQDIMDLGVRITDDLTETHKIKSIAFLSAAIIFDDGLWSPIEVEATLPTGSSGTFSIALMDERGLILSKSESVKGLKRGRDAFDIYFTLSGERGPEIAKGVKKLEREPGVWVQLSKLREFLKEHRETFNRRVAKYADGAPLPDCADFVLQALG